MAPVSWAFLGEKRRFCFPFAGGSWELLARTREAGSHWSGTGRYSNCRRLVGISLFLFLPIGKSGQFLSPPPPGPPPARPVFSVISREGCGSGGWFEREGKGRRNDCVEQIPSVWEHDESVNKTRTACRFFETIPNYINPWPATREVEDMVLCGHPLPSSKS